LVEGITNLTRMKIKVKEEVALKVWGREMCRKEKLRMVQERDERDK
jgi:hypothetical protein